MPSVNWKNEELGNPREKEKFHLRSRGVSFSMEIFSEESHEANHRSRYTT